MGHVATRTHLGDQFSEGARLLWAVMESRGWTQSQLMRAVEARPGVVPRWLYGDTKPSWDWAVRLRDVCGVPLEAWTVEPTAPFVVPALRPAESGTTLPADDDDAAPNTGTDPPS